MGTVWTIVIAVLVFSIMIFIHELGHFIAARSLGVGVIEFAIGMGPRIISYKGKKTIYAIRLFPIGGFCAMRGEDESDPSSDSLTSQPVWKRFIILVSGALMNILLGFAVTAVLVCISPHIYGTTVTQFADGAYTKEYLQENDTIVKVGASSVQTKSDLVYAIMREGVEPVDVVVKRDGAKITVPDVTFPTFTEEGVRFGQIDFYTGEINKNVGTVISESFFRSISTVKMIWQSLFDLLTGRYGVEQMSGPVGVTSAIGQAASQGIDTLLFMIAFITMNLGVFNLLPLPALDGGRIFFLLIELIRGKPVKPEYEGYVHLAGIVILLAFMAFVTYQDVLRLFR